MNELSAFLGVPHIVVLYGAAAFGSIAIEVAAFVREITVTRGALPAQYRTRSYYVAKILFALVAAGPLAVIFDAQTLSIAFYMGVSAPLIYDRLAAGIKHSDIDPVA
ncbi:MAG: hypothetical protein ACHQF3_12110 [Alphaproteobacteria bacterium]